MDILIHIGLIVISAFLFFLLRWTENPLIFGSILVISGFGLIISITSGVYIGTEEFQAINGIISEIKTDLGSWKYILDLTYIAFLFSSIVYWTLSRPEKDEFDDY